MELPHAAEIRVLRQLVERANRARSDLGMVEPQLRSLSMGSGNPEPLLERLRTEWPELDLSGDAFAALTKARLQLAQLVGDGEGVRGELHDLQHRQSHALEGEAFAEVRDELKDLGARKAGLAASIQPLKTAVSGLTPLLSVLRTQLDLSRKDLDVRPARAAGRALRLLESFRAACTSTGVDVSQDVDPDASPQELITALDEGLKRLEDVIGEMSREYQRLSAEYTELEARTRSRTG